MTEAEDDFDCDPSQAVPEADDVAPEPWPGGGRLDPAEDEPETPAPDSPDAACAWVTETGSPPPPQAPSAKGRRKEASAAGMNLIMVSPH